jgi:hypothetical protein
MTNEAAGTTKSESEVGFCSKCNILRHDDKLGPVTPCACFVAHHTDDCHLRIAVRSPISVACDAHDKDSCPACFSCTCGVAADRMFVCGRLVFSWELGIGLVLLRREPLKEGP